MTQFKQLREGFLVGFVVLIGQTIAIAADSPQIFQCKSMATNYSKFKDLELETFEEGKADCQPILTKLENNASTGTSRDKYLLALCYGHGLGVNKDLKKAMDYLERCLACGDKTSALAASLLGFIYKNGHFPRPWHAWVSNNNGPLYDRNREMKEELKPDPVAALKYYRQINGLDREQSMNANMQIAEIESDLSCGSVSEEAPDDCDVEQLANSGSDKDRKLALSCACSMDNVAQAEKECIVKTIQSMPKAGGSMKLNICDCATGPLGVVCAQRDSEAKQQTERNEFQNLAQSWNPEVRKEFLKLQTAADVYREAQAAWIDYVPPGEWAGTGHAAIEMGHDTQIRQEFSDFVAKLEKRSDAMFSEPNTLAQEDQRLNRFYTSCLKVFSGKEPEQKRSSDDSTETRHGKLMTNRYNRKPLPADGVLAFKDAERKWIKYRDAWVVFAQLRWKGKASPEKIHYTVSRLLTKARADALDIRWSCGQNPDHH